MVKAELRSLAIDDIDAAALHYRNEAGLTTALAFVDALEAAVGHLQQHPLTGSLRFAFELEIPELRSWPLQRFPYLVFYVAGDELVDIWRVLHSRRDVPAFLTSDRWESE